MGKFTKKLQVHDTSYNDFFKNELGKALTDVDLSLKDDTIVKKSIDNRRLKLSYGSIKYAPESNNRIERITVSAYPGGDFKSSKDFVRTVASQISGTYRTHDIESTLPYRSQKNNQAEYFYSLRSKYNYYAGGYEEQAAAVSERVLPNYYIQKSNLEDQKSNFSNPNKEFFKSIGLTQTIVFPPINNQKERNIFIDNLNSVESVAK